MALPQHPFPPVPESTFLAATALYGKGNLYIRLGDCMDELLGGQLPADNSATFKSHILPALLTVFQYLEELTNDQVLDAVRNRLDLKYILRLPMTAPTMTPKNICEYHRAQFMQPEHQRIMQILLDRLAEDSYLSQEDGQPLTADKVLATICTMCQLDEVTKAMHQALETLAVVHPEWLRQITLPYWYDRYNRGSRLTPLSYSDPKWNARAIEVVGDIKYLLQAIDQLSDPLVADLPEIKRIRQIMGEQFLVCLYEPEQRGCFQRMVKKCNGCNLISIT
jgi:hypothetical protein